MLTCHFTNSILREKKDLEKLTFRGKALYQRERQTERRGDRERSKRVRERERETEAGRQREK